MTQRQLDALLLWTLLLAVVGVVFFGGDMFYVGLLSVAALLSLALSGGDK